MASLQAGDGCVEYSITTGDIHYLQIGRAVLVDVPRTSPISGWEDQLCAWAQRHHWFVMGPPDPDYVRYPAFILRYLPETLRQEA